MDCPCCRVPIETQKIASVNFDICQTCLGIWLPSQAIIGIVAERGMPAGQFMSTLLGRIRKIEKGAYIDKLTNLGNRKYFDRQLAAELARAKGSHYLSLVLMDLDGFKPANDDFGHATGDFVLKEFGNILARFTRKSDCAARVGGDEFGLILPETDAIGAKAIASRIVKETAEHVFHAINGRALKTGITVSCGIAAYPPDLGEDAPDEADELRARLFDLADAALYAAKERGRAQAVYAGDLTDEERAMRVVTKPVP
jgi:diguanylate cyclase (GGDEF)-like protein